MMYETPGTLISFRRLTALATLLMLALTIGVGCGDSADVSEEHGALVSKAGHFEAHITPMPDPPVIGDNMLHVHLMDADGTALNGATLEATPFMPAHGHGTPEAPEVSEDDGDGMYSIHHIVYTMPGKWEVSIKIEHEGIQDEIVAKFDVQ